MRHRSALLAILLSAARAASAVDDAKAQTPLVGCWKSDDEPVTYERFGANGAWGYMRGGERAFGHATVGEKTIALSVMGGHVEESYVLDGDHLTVTGADGDEKEKSASYHRCAEPADFDPKPLQLGEPGPVAKGRLDQIKAELAKRLETDQGVRTGKLAGKDMHAVDVDNTKYLTGLVQELGWIDCARFGAESADAAFLIVQHSGDLPLMLAALPQIEQDVKAKRLDGQAFALLFDRLQLVLGRKQRYGSQIGNDDKGMVVLPLEDRAKVDQLRAELGMGQLKDYLRDFEGENNGKPIRFAGD